MRCMDGSRSQLSIRETSHYYAGVVLCSHLVNEHTSEQQRSLRWHTTSPQPFAFQHDPDNASHPFDSAEALGVAYRLAMIVSHKTLASIILTAINRNAFEIFSHQNASQTVRWWPRAPPGAAGGAYSAFQTRPYRLAGLRERGREKEKKKIGEGRGDVKWEMQGGKDRKLKGREGLDWDREVEGKVGGSNRGGEVRKREKGMGGKWFSIFEMVARLVRIGLK